MRNVAQHLLSIPLPTKWVSLPITLQEGISNVYPRLSAASRQCG